MNFQELQSSVASWLNRDNLTGIIPTFIRIAQLQLERNKRLELPYMHKESILTISNNYELTIPPNYKKPDYLFVVDSSGRRVTMNKVELRGAWTRFPYQSSNLSIPVIYATADGGSKFVVRPTPDTTYQYIFGYYAYSASLQNPEDTNWLTINAFDVLLYGALLQASPYLKSDDRIVTWGNLYSANVNDLIDTYKDEKHSGGYNQTTPSVDDIV